MPKELMEDCWQDFDAFIDHDVEGDDRYIKYS